ncbi:hypothetical protein FAF44_33685 [Nonomuraea sp. MG754425]|uniref:hypothetical protein n=1 Tax=Nonomuraea sp. MG754425 TaxID=2570319 RepID=UPI001F339C44|nr:hypothetical protein [Nonomuraea sp. MG754425]MCF6473299.1 hypothetical protein [Nonomuraea sp. MG754425]
MRKFLLTLLSVGMTAGALAVMTPPASAAGRWCNASTCIKTYDVGTWHGRVEVQIMVSANMTVHGRVWNSRTGWAVNTQVESFTRTRTYIGYTYPKRNFPAGSKLCAQGYQHLGGSNYRTLGLPCVTVTR